MKRHSLPVLVDWDAEWPVEGPFQVIAMVLIVDAASRPGAPPLRCLDTHTLSVPTDFNRTQAGAPDIIACVSGRWVSIELKSRNLKQTKHQRFEQERVESAGGSYTVARTMREVFDALGLEVPE